MRKTWESRSKFEAIDPEKIAQPIGSIQASEGVREAVGSAGEASGMAIRSVSRINRAMARKNTPSEGILQRR